MSEVYYVRSSIYSNTQTFQVWRTPPALWIPNIPAPSSSRTSSLDVDAGGPGHYLTGGGFIRHGEAVYMVIAPDMAAFGWRTCIAHEMKKHRRSHKDGSSSSSSSRTSTKRRDTGKTAHRASQQQSSNQHSACQELYDYHETTRAQQQETLRYQASGTPEIIGVLGHLVHFSSQHGFALVMLDPAGMYLLEEMTAATTTTTVVGSDHHGTGGHHDESDDGTAAVALVSILSQAVPLGDLRGAIDDPEITDFVEFSTASGEEDTGLVGGVLEYCFASAVPSRHGTGSSKRGASSNSSSSSRGIGSSRSTGDDEEQTMTTRLLVVTPSSYTATSADCGLSVRRSVASERPLLLGQVVGLVGGDEIVISHDDEDVGGGGMVMVGSAAAGGERQLAGMLVLPLVGFAEEMEKVISKGRFNLL
ncbi:uncharacterized protein B0I36DRAFT_391718 [Microdochium trichocladiopsis]|uniref:Uncharacterized protein n=1 Tax=Microdochium trichocladiopsis TaxID=1682393 RepID=A0A9P8YIX9_9PEZI|nr:uncharacterized protein B0I36DRAFT_391718 [Microdochium trichocladiopsis]KAH7040868.1 hypothetical protein B0I36DRAFT_391718 [Microdochium trichocladiopsis]